MAKGWVLKGGSLVDPLARGVVVGDLRLSDGRIQAVGGVIAPQAGDEEIRAEGLLVMPGLTDMHMHLDGSEFSHAMLARAGVTTAFDVGAVDLDGVLTQAAQYGAGLTVAYLYALAPGKTLESENPCRAELERVFDFALTHGAMGVKLLGGHYPLTPEASALAIAIAHERRCWVAFHAGSTAAASDVDGLLEVLTLADGKPVHVAHINSYCRGNGGNSPLDEAKTALDALKRNPMARSESYLALVNGTSGRIGVDGKPASRVTCSELVRGGFSVDEAGLLAAIAAGWAQVNYPDFSRRETVLAAPEAGLEYYRRCRGVCAVSFRVNSPLSAIPLALAKDAAGRFIVDALATDGGNFPRNVTLQQGLRLVEFGALTLNELAYKAAYRPSLLMGLYDRGRLDAGASGAVTVVDPVRRVATWVFADGVPIVRDEVVVGGGAKFVTGVRGRSYFEAARATATVTEPRWLAGVPRSEEA